MTDTQPAGQTPGTASLPPPEVGSPRPPEPSTPPAQQPPTARAAAGPPPGTLDGPGVLGRALLDRFDDVWVSVGDGWWREPARRRHWTTRQVDREYGPVREVLLVDPAALLDGQLAGSPTTDATEPATRTDAPAGSLTPAAGRVLDAARRVAGLEIDWEDWRQVAAAHRELRAAVDALDRPTTGGSTEQYEAVRRYADQQLRATATYQTGLPSGLKVGRPGRDRAAEPAPEPAGDSVKVRLSEGSVEGLGTERVPPSLLAAMNAPSEPAGDGPGWNRHRLEAVDDEQVIALLADRDRQEDNWKSTTLQMLAVAEERDAARVELAGAARSARDSAAYAEQGWAEVQRTRAEVVRLHAELVEMTPSRDRWHGHALDLRGELAVVADERDRLRGQRDAATAELDTLQAAITAATGNDDGDMSDVHAIENLRLRWLKLVDVLEERTAELATANENIADGIRVLNDEAPPQGPMGRLIAERLATARRDAALDTLAWVEHCAQTDVESEIVPEDRKRVHRDYATLLRRMKDQVRAGVVPGSPQPASEEGGQDG